MKTKNFAPSPVVASWITLVLILIGTATSSVAKDTDPARMGPSTTLQFNDKQSDLTPESRLKLRNLIAEAQSHGKISEIQVASWSDNPVPRDGESLSKPDRDLAAKRGAKVKSYLKSRKMSWVSNYNMAERASWLAKTFDTSDAELKAEIGRGGDQQMSQAEFQVFKNGGQPSRSVVLVIMKH
jgi:hypothetical protein